MLHLNFSRTDLSQKELEISMRFDLITSQQAWKKAIGKSSGPGALSPSKSLTTPKTSTLSKGLTNLPALSSEILGNSEHLDVGNRLYVL